MKEREQGSESSEPSASSWQAVVPSSWWGPHHRGNHRKDHDGGCGKGGGVLSLGKDGGGGKSDKRSRVREMKLGEVVAHFEKMHVPRFIAFPSFVRNGREGTEAWD